VQTNTFDNYKITLNSTLSSIITKNGTQDQQITNITNVLPLLLSIDAFNIHIDGLNSTFGTVFNINNTQDTNNKYHNDIIYKLIYLIHYTGSLNSTLTSILNNNYPR
jgi:hypothetical protein